jgi:hypothetical protein
MFKRIVAAFWLGMVFFSSQTVPVRAETTVIFTPRLWYSFVSTAEVFKGGTVVNHTAVPLYGASLSIIPANMGGTTFSLTGFYGNGNGDYQESVIFVGKNDVTRMDIEGVVQFPIAAGAYWSLGLRYVKADTEETGVAAPVAQPFKFITHGQYFLGEIGIGASTPLNSEGSQRLFGGLTALAGQRREESTETCCGTPTQQFSSNDMVAGVDANFGYSFTLGSSTTFFARYRIFVLSEVERFASPGALTIVHGPELNLSMKLN